MSDEATESEVNTEQTTTIGELTPSTGLSLSDKIPLETADEENYHATMSQVKSLVYPPEADSLTAGLVNTSAQAFSGKKTFGSGIATTTLETSGDVNIGGDMVVDGSLEVSNTNIITALSEKLDNTTSPDNAGKVVGVDEDGSLTFVEGGGGGSALVPDISQTEYDLLPPEVQNNGQIRHITDAEETPVPFAVVNDDITTSANVWTAQKTKNEIDNTVESAIETHENKHNYSTTETVIGKWIDGRPIYRKVFVLNTPISVADQWTVLKVKENEDLILRGRWFSNTTVYNKNNFSGEFTEISNDSISGNIQAFNKSLSEPANVYMYILEYTKTTDIGE